MSDQAHHWSEAAGRYEEEFVDPYRLTEGNPLLRALGGVAGPNKTVVDLGCGIGPLLPELAARFGRVIAVDFAAGMLERARQRCQELTGIEFHQLDLADLRSLCGQADVAVAVNSLVQPSVQTIEVVLRQIHDVLRPGGTFMGIVPAVDAVHYQTMLLLDRALERGLPEEAARKNAAGHGEHALYDFAFGDFRYAGLEQHFWQPFEIPYRLGRCGFRGVRREKIRLDRAQFACAGDLQRYPAPWDWFFQAEVSPCVK